jgi:hypothetical protein
VNRLLGAFIHPRVAVITALVPLPLLWAAPWLGHLPPWSWVGPAASAEVYDPCNGLAACVAAVTAYLLPHQLIFRYNPLLRRHAPAVGLLAGEVVGIGLCSLVWAAYVFGKQTEGAGDLILAAASLALSLIVSLMITLHASRMAANVGWRSAAADALALFMVGWAVLVSQSDHFAAHQGFGVAVLVGATSMANAHYVITLLFEDAAGEPAGP